MGNNESNKAISTIAIIISVIALLSVASIIVFYHPESSDLNGVENNIKLLSSNLNEKTISFSTSINNLESEIKDVKKYLMGEIDDVDCDCDIDEDDFDDLEDDVNDLQDFCCVNGSDGAQGPQGIQGVQGIPGVCESGIDECVENSNDWNEFRTCVINLVTL